MYYAVEGDYKNAGLSALAAVPVVGYVGNGIKYGSKVADISKSTRSKGIDNSKVVYPSKPHINKTAGHWETMVDKANELAKSDNISKVYLNKGISNEIPGVKPNRRPDIMAVRKDGKIDQYEVPSKTDDVNALINRMQDTQRLLGDRAGNINILRIK
ncbi:hypothetical protein [Gracilibacillus kekensis]|uniref:Uncharacterized protein n=1 Tax=Gracilibacillus kekensis TaxID=1027249 RepID=A0A1M7KJ01_9BACI|nr:hypothetical protein [Gracilibacillus kekensis]SHM65371.1 hypothetical protein SAMN05216179_0734 [Gracilibacillus kekensis]